MDAGDCQRNRNEILRRGGKNGTHADQVFPGSSKDKAHDEQREEPAYHAAGSDSGDPAAVERPGGAFVCRKRAEYCIDGVWKISAEEIRTPDRTDGRDPGAAQDDGRAGE